MDKLPQIRTFSLLRPIVDSYRLRLVSVFGYNGSEVIFATVEDRVYGFGQNRFGCLGVGTDDSPIPEPTLMAGLSGVCLANLYSGYGHCVGVTETGGCYTWGDNSYGQSGTQSEAKTANAPQLVRTLTGKHVVAVECGNAHTLVLTSEGVVYGWGRNMFGQIGNYTYDTALTPQPVLRVPNGFVVSVACGRHHSLALTDTGRVYVWGLNEFGQLGRPRERDIRLTRDKAVSNRPQMMDIGDEVMVKKACCGSNHTLLLTIDGDLYAFGHNDTGQVGDGSFETQFTPIRINREIKFKDIVAIYDNNLSIGVSIEGEYYVWGFKKYSTPHRIPELPIDYTLFDVYAQYSRIERLFKTIIIENDEIVDFRPIIGSVDCDKQEEMGAKGGETVADNEQNGSHSVAEYRFDESGEDEYLFTEEDNCLIDLSDGQQSRPQSTAPSLMGCPEVNTRRDLRAEFQRHLKTAFYSRNGCDLRFKVNGRHIYCHKTILSIRNKKFYANCDKYLNNYNNTTNEILIQSYSYETFKAFVAYLYGLLAPTLTEDNVGYLLRLATIYEEPELRDRCLQFIGLTNVCALYMKAIETKLQDLETACFAFMSDHWKRVCSSDQFWTLDVEIRKKLMSLLVN